MMAGFEDQPKLDTILHALQQTEERLKMVIFNLPVVLFVVDCSGMFTLYDGKKRDHFILDPDKTVGRYFYEIPEITQHLREIIEKAMNGEMHSVEVESDGEVFELFCSPLSDKVGEIHGMLGIGIDISSRKESESRLKDSEERYRNLVENQGEGVMILDDQLRIEYINVAGENILDETSETLIGTDITRFIPPISQEKMKQQLELRKLGTSTSYELGIMSNKRIEKHLLITATPRFDSTGNFHGSFVVFHDITERKRLEESLRYKSYHDSLTGLFNRAYIDEQLKQINIDRKLPIGIIMVDVDGLKQTNDHLGHLIGDQLLRKVGRVLQRSFREGDIVARIGGDEFVILLPNTDQAELEHMMERLRLRLDHANKDYTEMNLSISIGGASAKADQSIHSAYELADQRMYRDKRAKKISMYLDT